MFIKSLKLQNFRNYSALDIQFSEKFNILYGNNGQGKTNILEAIFLCSSGRSHRSSRDIDLIKLNEKYAYIKIELDKQEEKSTIEVLLKSEEKKKIKINEIPLKKVGKLMGHLNTVIFSPEDLKIIKEGPSDRRRFIDITICQLRPSYFFDLQQYSKILLQRNSLLKEIQNNRRSLLDTLDTWNNQLLTIGSRIMKVRSEFILRLSEAAERNHYKLSDGKEKLSLKYIPSIKTNDFQDIPNVFQKVLDNNIKKEIAKGMTLFGPHRDDYELFINDSSLKAYGSQGQQRTSVLSLKLSEIDIVKEDTDQFPVLLLDDVMSELDNCRQEYLLNNLEGIQTFITCTDKSFFKEGAASDAFFYQVSNGEAHKN